MEGIGAIKGPNLYISNIDYGIDTPTLCNEFSQFGHIISAKIIYENGRSKGYGFVMFSTVQEAIEAMIEMHGKMLGTRPILVSQAWCKERRHLQKCWERQVSMSSADARPILVRPSSPNEQLQGFAKQNVVPTGNCPQTLGIVQRAVPMQRPDLPTDTMLAAAACPQGEKQVLAERLFPLIQQMYPDFAGKITRMLLEITNSELLHMLVHKESLKAAVEEAVAVLQLNQSIEAAVKIE